MLCFPALLSLILGCRSRSQFELFQESHLTLDLDLGRSLQLIRDDTLSRDHRNSSKNENRQSKDCHLKQNIHKIWVFWLLLGFMYFCSWLAENHKSYMFMLILMYVFSPCQVVPGVCLSQKVPQCATSNTPKRHPFFLLKWPIWPRASLTAVLKRVISSIQITRILIWKATGKPKFHM